MSRHAAPKRSRWPLAELPDHQQGIAFVAVGLAVCGLVLGALTVTRAQAAEPASPGGAQSQMTFSYSADVGRTPAYDGTTARSPDPVFRRVAGAVDVQYRYSGLPGTIDVVADLSTGSGWHSTLDLAPPARFVGDSYTGRVRLDLAAIEGRAAAAGRITGMPAGQVTVAVTPRVQTASAVTFAPALKLTLTPLQLALAGDPSTLSVSAPGQAAARHSAATVSVLGHHLPPRTARTLSAAALVTALFLGALLALWVRLADPGSEAGRIRRRYAPLLARVRPIPECSDRATVDLADFPTLAKIAERYGLLVLHWASSEGDTFVVQDHDVTYRHLVRAGRDLPAAALTS